MRCVVRKSIRSAVKRSDTSVEYGLKSRCLGIQVEI